MVVDRRHARFLTQPLLTILLSFGDGKSDPRLNESSSLKLLYIVDRIQLFSVMIVISSW